MHYRYLFHNTQSKRFRRVLHFKGVCDKQKINLKQSLSKFDKVHFFMYVFIYLYAGQLGDINERAKERYRLFSPKMFKLNTY